jgi:hypothetical protein
MNSYECKGKMKGRMPNKKINKKFSKEELLDGMGLSIWDSITHDTQFSFDYNKCTIVFPHPLLIQTMLLQNNQWEANTVGAMINLLQPRITQPIWIEFVTLFDLERLTELNELIFEKKTEYEKIVIVVYFNSHYNVLLLNYENTVPMVTLYDATPRNENEKITMREDTEKILGGIFQNEKYEFADPILVDNINEDCGAMSLWFVMELSGYWTKTITKTNRDRRFPVLNEYVKLFQDALSNKATPQFNEKNGGLNVEKATPQFNEKNGGLNVEKLTLLLQHSVSWLDRYGKTPPVSTTCSTCKEIYCDISGWEGEESLPSFDFVSTFCCFNRFHLQCIKSEAGCNCKSPQGLFAHYTWDKETKNFQLCFNEMPIVSPSDSMANVTNASTPATKRKANTITIGSKEKKRRATPIVSSVNSTTSKPPKQNNGTTSVSMDVSQLNTITSKPQRRHVNSTPQRIQPSRNCTNPSPAINLPVIQCNSYIEKGFPPRPKPGGKKGEITQTILTQPNESNTYYNESNTTAASADQQNECNTTTVANQPNESTAPTVANQPNESNTTTIANQSNKNSIGESTAPTLANQPNESNTTTIANQSNENSIGAPKDGRIADVIAEAAVLTQPNKNDTYFNESNTTAASADQQNECNTTTVANQPNKSTPTLANQSNKSNTNQSNENSIGAPKDGHIADVIGVPADGVVVAGDGVIVNGFEETGADVIGAPVKGERSTSTNETIPETKAVYTDAEGCSGNTNTDMAHGDDKPPSIRSKPPSKRGQPENFKKNLRQYTKRRNMPTLLTQPLVTPSTQITKYPYSLNERVKKVYASWQYTDSDYKMVRVQPYESNEEEEEERVELRLGDRVRINQLNTNTGFGSTEPMTCIDFKRGCIVTGITVMSDITTDTLNDGSVYL